MKIYFALVIVEEPTTKDGTSFYNLIEGATAIGFDAKGLTGKLEEINVNNLPCIVQKKRENLFLG